MPLGEGRDINSYLNTAKRSARAGVRYSDRTSQDRGWSMATDRDLRNNRTSVSGNLDFVTPVSQLNASVSHDSDNYTNWSTRAGVITESGGQGLALNAGQRLAPVMQGRLAEGKTLTARLEIQPVLAEGDARVSSRQRSETMLTLTLDD
ncbi:fimbrial biogenesis outer membrane usher protein [Serratia fonticola AU-AP2C]|nr:fimbrial biogenesis outer membrane usher protein [Serratia fonticola AU-AP2C]